MHAHAGLAGYRLIKPRATPHGPSTAAEEVGQPPHRLTGRPTAHRATSDSLAARRAAEDELGDLGEGGVVGRVEVAGADHRRLRRLAGDARHARDAQARRAVYRSTAARRYISSEVLI